MTNLDCVSSTAVLHLHHHHHVTQKTKICCSHINALAGSHPEKVLDWLKMYKWLNSPFTLSHTTYTIVILIKIFSCFHENLLKHRKAVKQMPFPVFCLFLLLHPLFICLSCKTCYLILQSNIYNIQVFKEESTGGFLPGRASREANSSILTPIMHSFFFLLAWSQILFYTHKQHIQLIHFYLWPHFLSVNHFLYLLRKYTALFVCLFCHYTQFCALLLMKPVHHWTLKP